jgi:hypothetical protein
MPACGREAVLLITTTPHGTATNVARSRTLLRCTLAAGHDGDHRDEVRAEAWADAGTSRRTLLRHEDEGGTG